MEKILIAYGIIISISIALLELWIIPRRKRKVKEWFENRKNQ